MRAEVKENMKKIFAVNLGSTSTKVAYYEDDTCIYNDAIRHDAEELKQYQSVFDQTDMRLAAVEKYLKEHHIDPGELDAFVSRGGSTEPIVSGVYEINEAMLEQVESGNYGVHVCSVGCRIAWELTRGTKALPLTVDTPSTDELQPLARYSGLKEIQRKSCIQALNQKAMAKYFADREGKRYEELNLIVVMLGGGISVVAHEKGRMVDAPDALEGDGPFSNNRCGTLPAGDLVKLCYSGKYDEKAMMRHINGEAGLMSYLGTTDIRAIMKDIEGGDEYAAEVLEAMCYQTGKDIGACATVLKGQVDAILFIGGMANVDWINDKIRQRVEFIAPVVVMPGEREMEALCLGAYGVLSGTEELKEFRPKEVV